MNRCLAAGPLALIVVTCILFAFPSAVSAIEWEKDFQEGLDEAIERNAPIFVFFGKRT